MIFENGIQNWAILDIGQQSQGACSRLQTQCLYGAGTVILISNTFYNRHNRLSGHWKTYIRKQRFPFTAMRCIGYIMAALNFIAKSALGG